MVKRNDMDDFPRTTSRLLALEAAKKAKQQQHQETSNVASIRKVQKEKRLDNVKDTKFGSSSQQGEVTVNHESLTYGKANLPSEQQIPDKKVLEFVIDVLQGKDKRDCFAEPVNGDKVEDYYDYIKKPMDFGTMRTKLCEGNYITLKQFEDDVYLICNNAISFNSSSTIFYREARTIQELADSIFTTLKANPENIFEEFSKKTRLCQKSNCEAEGSSAKRDKKAKGKRPARKRFELINETRVNFNEAGWRHTYQPSTLREETYVCPVKQLVLKNDDVIKKHGYTDSLRRFVKNLGPVAQKVANEKLMLLNQIQSRSLLEPSRNEIQEHVNYNDNVTANIISPPTIRSSDPRQKGKMAETSYLSQLVSDMPSFVSPISSVYPSTIVQESSLGLSGNMFQPSYSQTSHQESYNFSEMLNRSSYSRAPHQQRCDNLLVLQQPLNQLGMQNQYFQPPNQVITQNPQTSHQESYNFSEMLNRSSYSRAPHQQRCDNLPVLQQPLNQLGMQNQYFQPPNQVITQNPQTSHQESYNFSEMLNHSGYSRTPHQQRCDNLPVLQQPLNQLSMQNQYFQSLNQMSTQIPYFQPLDAYQGIQQYSAGPSQSQSRSKDHDLHPHMMNPKI